MSDPKRPPRVRDASIFRTLHLNPHKRCCLCGAAYDLELHHVLGRAQGGSDVRENLVFLCAEEHRRITVNDPMTRSLLGQHLVSERLDVIGYVLGYLGQEQGAEWLRGRLFLDISP